MRPLDHSGPRPFPLRVQNHTTPRQLWHYCIAAPFHESMATRSHTHHRLTTTRSSQVSPSASAYSSGSCQQNSGHKPSKRNYSATDRPQRPELPCSGMISHPEDVTDVVLASEYQYLSAPWPQPRSWTPDPYDAVIPEFQTWSPRVLDARRLGSSALSGRPKRARWDDRDDRLTSPPMTPYIGRLESPKLEPMKCSGSFCDCCLDGERYFVERGKMDYQSRCSSSLRESHEWIIVVVVDSEVD